MGLTVEETIDLIDQLEAPLAIPFGQWVATGNPTNPITQSIQDTYRGMCNIYAASPAAIQQIAGDFTWIDSICSPWLGNAAPTPPVGGDFLGGQCPGVLYNGDIQIAFSRAPSPVLQVISWVGALQSLNATRFVVQPGFIEELRFVQVADSGTVSFSILPRGFGDIPVSYTFGNIRRVDGLPDDCGNRPVGRTPSGNPAPQIPPRPDPNEPTRRVPPPPIRINPDNTLQPDTPADRPQPRIDIRPPNGVPGNNPPPPGGSGGPSPKLPPPPAAEPPQSGEGRRDAPAGRRIVGVLTTAQPTSAASQFILSSQNLLVPRVGNVRFGKDNFETDPESIRLGQQVTPCLIDGGADYVRIDSAAPFGVVLSYQLLTREVAT